MILLSEEVTIPLPPDKIWALLSDPAAVASCIPGAALGGADGGGTYRGTMRLRLGPIVSVFRGEATVRYDHEARRCTVDGRGVDSRGESRSLASGVVSVSGDTATVLKVEGGFSMSGPLEAAANLDGPHVCRSLLDEFAQNIAKLVVAEGTPAPEAAVIPLIEPEAAPEAAAAVAAARQRQHRPTPEQEELAVAAAPPLEAFEPTPEVRGGPPIWRAFVGGLRVALNRKGRP